MKRCFNNPKLSDFDATRGNVFVENVKLIRELERSREHNCALWAFIILLAFIGICAMILCAASEYDTHREIVSYNATK